jgi:hypothetical protein
VGELIGGEVTLLAAWCAVYLPCAVERPRALAQPTLLVLCWAFVEESLWRAAAAPTWHLASFASLAFAIAPWPALRWLSCACFAAIALRRLVDGQLQLSALVLPWAARPSAGWSARPRTVLRASEMALLLAVTTVALLPVARVLGRAEIHAATQRFLAQLAIAPEDDAVRNPSARAVKVRHSKVGEEGHAEK